MGGVSSMDAPRKMAAVLVDRKVVRKVVMSGRIDLMFC